MNDVKLPEFFTTDEFIRMLDEEPSEFDWAARRAVCKKLRTAGYFKTVRRREGRNTKGWANGPATEAQLPHTMSEKIDRLLGSI